MPEDIGPSFTGNQVLTVAGTAVGFTASNFSEGGFRLPHAFIQVQGEAVRWAADGTTPTAAIGIEAEAGSIIKLNSVHQVESFLAIRRDGVSATLHASFGR